MTDGDLRAWAERIIARDPNGKSHITVDVAPAVLRLFKERDAYWSFIQDQGAMLGRLNAQCLAQAERIAAQSELLSNRAEKV